MHALTVNVGQGEGISVRQMIAGIREVSGTAGDDWSQPVVAPRRAGDPPRVVAPADTVRAGWEAQHDLRDMVASAWARWTVRTSAVAG